MIDHSSKIYDHIRANFKPKAAKMLNHFQTKRMAETFLWHYQLSLTIKTDFHLLTKTYSIICHISISAQTTPLMLTLKLCMLKMPGTEINESPKKVSVLAIFANSWKVSNLEKTWITDSGKSCYIWKFAVKKSLCLKETKNLSPEKVSVSID